MRGVEVQRAIRDLYDTAKSQVVDICTRLRNRGLNENTSAFKSWLLNCKDERALIDEYVTYNLRYHTNSSRH